MIAFDSDVVIYAADPDHPNCGSLRHLLFVDDADEPEKRIGSVVLLPEVLSKPTRRQDADTLLELSRILVRIDLLPTTRAAAARSTVLAAKYGLRAADAIHLATAIEAGADRFVTNNRRDFGKHIEEIDVSYPDDLVAPDACAG